MSTEPMADVLPLRPADERAGLGPSRSTRPRARVREDDAPEREPRRISIKLPMPSARAVNGVLAGSSLMASAQPAVLTVWAGHRQAAEFYRFWYAKYPRLAYGAAHAFIEVPFLYLWAWSGHSPVLRVAVVATILIILRLLGVHVIWSWL